MEVSIHSLVHAATEIIAVRYSGDPAAANLLIKHGWIDGADQGFGRGNSGENVLRGLADGKVVFPGDVIVLHPDWTREVFEYEVFLERYEEPDEIIVLADGQEEPPVDWDKLIPTGHNPDAVLLEPPIGAGSDTSTEVSRDSVLSDAEVGADPAPPPQPVDETVDDEDEDNE